MHDTPCSAGEPDAALGPAPVPELAELYRAYGRRVHAICLAHLGDVAAAEDAVQEVFLRAAPRLRQPHRAPVEAYLDGIARNVCRDELRRRRRAWSHGTVAVTGESAHPADVAMQHVTIDTIWRQLSLRDRMVMVHRFAGYSRAEIAQRLHMSVKAVDMGLMRARKRARDLIGGALALVDRTCRRRRRPPRWARRRPPALRSLSGRALTTAAAVTTAGLALSPHLASLSATQPTASVAPVRAIPGDISLTDVLVAGDGRTLFAAGNENTPACAGCAVLYRGGGAGWTRLPARGFAGGRLVAAPDAGRLLLSAGPRGLQRSGDGGTSFVTVVPAIGPAALLPAPVPATAIVATPRRLLVYRLGDGAIGPGPALRRGDTPVDAVGVDARTVLVSVVRAGTDRSRSSAAAVVRCTLGGACADALVAPGTPALRLVAARGAGGGVAAYARDRMYVGTARGFTEVGDAGPGTVVAMAAAGTTMARMHLVAITWNPRDGRTGLLDTRDGGRTWSALMTAADLSGVRALAITAEGRLIAAGTASAGPLQCSVDGRLWDRICAS